MNIRWNYLMVVVLLSTLLALTLPAFPAHAGGTVTVCDEANLRTALAGGGTVTFSCSGSIHFTSTFKVEANTTIDGSGQAVTINGSNTFGAFVVNRGISLSLKNLTVNGGRADYGGGVENYGTLNVYNTTFSNHMADNAGGAISNEQGATLYVANSTFLENRANNGGAIANLGKATVSNSTFFHNWADGGGTLSSQMPGTLTIINSTIANSSAPMYSAIFSLYGQVLLKNTIIANSTGAAETCWMSISDGGGNLTYPDDGTCPAGIHIDPLLDPNGLKNNGGPTQTIALLAGSPAIDKGTTTYCQDSLLASGSNWIDQRGYNRFADGPDGDTVAQCDIGAFEYGSTSVVQGPVDDTTPPQVFIQQTPEIPDGANGWYRSPVTLQPTATDEFEVIELRCALDPAAPPASFDDLPQERCLFLEGAPVSADGPHTFYAAALDINGNRSEVVSTGFQIDATPPVITCPAAGPFLLHSGDQTVGPAGVDASVSGLDEAASTLSGVVTADSIGLKTLTFTVFDLAGNSASLDCSYNVIYDFAGFYPPVKPAPAVNSATAGSAIPLKFSLAGDQGLDIFAVGFPSVQPVDCGTLTPVGDLSPIDTAGKSRLSYNPLTDWYNYVWKTDKAWAGTCHMLILQLIDGAQYKAYFQFQ